MTYFHDHSIRIRDMEPGDARIFTDAETASGWHQTIDKYKMRLAHQAQGKAIVLTAEYDGQPAGYISLYPNTSQGAFVNRGLPEIVDLGVLEKYRRRGVGTALLNAAERIAAQYADTVYLGVGLHAGYGAAQRLYILRGYVPDGSGVWYGNQVCPPYTDCCNDDELILYMAKKLR